MKCRLLLIALLWLCTSAIEAQDFKICYQTGYGFYDMSSFSAITERINAQFAFETKIISNYPAYFYYQPMIKLSFQNVETGLLYLFQTSGSRVSSKDYSGEYRFDTHINCNSMGIIINPLLKDYNKIKLYLTFEAGMNFSTLKAEEYFQLNTTVNRSDDEFTSQSFYFEPGFNLSYEWKRLNFECNIGYFKEFSRKNYTMVGDSRNEIEVDKNFADADVWDGFRSGLTVSYTLHYHEAK
jgi:hypothetical protein